MTANPPKPRFALSVGVVGHRPKDLAKAGNQDGVHPALQDISPNIERDIRLTLSAISAAAVRARKDHFEYFDQFITPPQILTLVSALAEGADTIAAQIAHELEYTLEAPLPFARLEYEKDFQYKADEKAKLSQVDADKATKRALDAYHALLDKVSTTFELPGQHALSSDNQHEGKLREQRAYEAAGLTVLSQADIVLAVWDHELARGRGGTAELVAEAARAGIPIVLVDAKGVEPVKVHWRNLMKFPAPIVAIDDLPSESLEVGIPRVVDELVRLPKTTEQREGAKRWFNEDRHCVNIRFGFPLLRSVFFAPFFKLRDFFPRLPDDIAKEYVDDASPVLHATQAKSILKLATPYGWADAVANYFAQFFRSAFVLNFFFAAFAVVAASSGVTMGDAEGLAEKVPAGLEILLIVCVILNTILGYFLGWHHRWVEAREIAERLRAALPLWTLGLRPGFFPGEEPTWTGWYARAIVRMQGLRAGNLNIDHMSAERTVLLKMLDGQCRYNRRNAKRARRLERGLEWIGIVLLGATLAIAFDHLTGSEMMSCAFDDKAHDVTIWLSVALPALATASYGVRVIGDFEGIFHRAGRTSHQLEQLAIAINQDPTELAMLRARARTAADIMLGDVASWRLSAESRGLAIPG